MADKIVFTRGVPPPEALDRAPREGAAVGRQLARQERVRVVDDRHRLPVPAQGRRQQPLDVVRVDQVERARP